MLLFPLHFKISADIHGDCQYDVCSSLKTPTLCNLLFLNYYYQKFLFNEIKGYKSWQLDESSQEILKHFFCAQLLHDKQSRKSSLTRSLSTVQYDLPIEIHPEIFMQLVSLSTDFFLSHMILVRTLKRFFLEMFLLFCPSQRPTIDYLICTYSYLFHKRK